MCFGAKPPAPPPTPAPTPPVEPIEIGEPESPSVRKKRRSGATMLQIPLIKDVAAGLGIPKV